MSTYNTLTMVMVVAVVMAVLMIAFKLAGDHKRRVLEKMSLEDCLAEAVSQMAVCMSIISQAYSIPINELENRINTEIINLDNKLTITKEKKE